MTIFKNSAFNTVQIKAVWESANLVLIPGWATQRG